VAHVDPWASGVLKLDQNRPLYMTFYSNIQKRTFWPFSTHFKVLSIASTMTSLPPVPPPLEPLSSVNQS
jgi:hypothetical protein